MSPFASVPSRTLFRALGGFGEHPNLPTENHGETITIHQRPSLVVELQAMNAILAIYPYKYEGLWVFDDEKADLEKEPFISGADTIIDHFVEDIPGAESGFRLIFSQFEFPGHDAVFTWVRPDGSGNWYRLDALDMEGWLCPALLKYFDEPPKQIYAKFEPKG